MSLKVERLGTVSLCCSLLQVAVHVLCFSSLSLSVLTLLVGLQEWHLACKMCASYLHIFCILGNLSHLGVTE